MHKLQDVLLVLIKKRTRFVDEKMKAIANKDINKIIYCDKNIENIEKLMEEIRKLYMK